MGIAIEDGHIDDLDDQVPAYVPEFAGSSHTGTTTRDLLTVSSGVDFDGGYDATSADIDRIFVRAMGFGQPVASYLEAEVW